jgi:D-alanyl-D-alanine carboxypeptidase
MAGPRSRQQQRSTVGGRGKSTSWQPIFTGAILAVAASFIVLVIIAADSFGGSGGGQAGPGTDPSGTAQAETATADPAGTTTPGTGEPTRTPANEPGPDGTIVVACNDILAPLDKQHRLPADCVPPDLEELPGAISAQGAQYLRSEALAALRELFQAARAEGYLLQVNSSYRSYQTQADTYNYWVQTYGKDQADRTSARPGHSEHQLGTTADVGAGGRFLEAFIGSTEADWLAENSWKHGFIISYADGTEDITGYAYEPWHIRYVGVEVAAEVHASGLTLGEFLLR